MYVNILKRNSYDTLFMVIAGSGLLFAGFALYYMLP